MMPLDKPIGQILGIGALVLLAIGCTVVLWPFLSSLAWAAVICFSTWPICRHCERLVGGPIAFLGKPVLPIRLQQALEQAQIG